MDAPAEQARHAGSELTSELADNACFVNADRMRLRQIVDNLLANAIKFTPAGGSVHLSVRVESGSAVVLVQDTGIGFDSGFAEKLFEPFVRDDPDGVQSSGGLGLGLTIASRLAALLGGNLKARSPGKGRGAEFTLSIPVVGEITDVCIEDHIPAGLGAGMILVVENNRDLADGLAELLRLKGAAVLTAADGAAALECALAVVPDVILCDVRLPGEMGGYAVARACRGDATLKNVRLVAVSGYSSPGNLADAEAAEFDSYLVKPLTEEALRTLIP